MSTSVVCPNSKHIQLPCLVRVEVTRPIAWLRQGWGDFKRDPVTSVSLGAAFAILGALLVNHAWAHSHLVMALTTGFMLVAPFLAMVFYDLVQRQEGAARGRPVAAFAGLRRNAGSIGLFAVLLAFILSGWERLSAILVGLFFSHGFVAADAFSFAHLFTQDMGFVLAYVGLGALIAALTFSLSVVSMPMLMDREVDLVTALMTSLWTVRENFGAMVVWAAAIAGLTLIGFATAFIGLAVIFPMLGYATWHAYRELVQAQ